MRILTIHLLVVSTVLAQVKVATDIIHYGSVDSLSAASTAPVKGGVTLPATCVQGELFFKTDATPGENLYGCVSTNMWAVLTGGASISLPLGISDGGTGQTTGPAALTAIAPSTTANDMFYFNGTQHVRIPIVTGPSICFLPGPPPAWGTCPAATSVSGLSDFKTSLTSATVLDVAAGTLSVGNNSIPVAACTFTRTAGSGSGTVLIFVTEAGVVTIEHPTSAGLTITASSGCVSAQVTTPAVPGNSKFLSSTTVVSGSFTTVTEKRGFVGGTPIISGTGIVVTPSGGVSSIAIDTSDVPRLSASNAFTGTGNFKAAVSLGQPRGSGSPSSGTCDSAGEVSDVYTDTDAGGGAYDCRQISSGVYGWVARGTTSSTFTFITQTESHSIVDDFTPNSLSTGSLGALGWVVDGTPACLAYSDIDHPGVCRTMSANPANSAARFRLVGANPDTGFFVSPQTSTGKPWASAFAFRIVGASLFHAVVGWASESSDNPSNGIYARLYNSASGCSANNSSETTWQFTSRASGTETSSASTQTFTNNTWYYMTIRSTTSGTILYSLAKAGGAPEAEVSISTNVPTANLYPVFQIINCEGGVSKQIYADYFAFQRTGLTR